MEALGGTGNFSAGLSAPETREPKLVSDRSHNIGRCVWGGYVEQVVPAWLAVKGRSIQHCRTALCSGRTYRVGDELAGRGPAGSLCSRVMEKEWCVVRVL